MYWYKVKNLLIVIFLIINLFLITFIFRGNILKQNEEIAKKNALTKALTANNIMIDEQLLSSESSVVNVATAENIIPHDKKLAEAFFNGQYETVTEDNITKYKQNSKTLYTSNGKLFFINESLTPEKKPDENSVSNAINKLLEYGFDMSHATPSVYGDNIVFTYNFNGEPLYENNLYVKMSGKRIAYISGYLIKINTELTEEKEVKSVSEILIDFIQDENRPEKIVSVTSVTLGYSLLLADSSVDFKKTETIPTYKITIDNNTSYFYDARK